jgi:cobalt-zinc-cadmium resistance protein CzcA
VVSKIVALALRQRVLVLISLFVLFGAGIFAFVHLNIEAYPDPVPPYIDVVTQDPGKSAEEIERYITIPIETQMAGIPNVTATRSISLFGLSDVKVQFNYDFTFDQAEQWVVNRLSELEALPDGAQPQISPQSPIGEIYRYRVVGPPGYSLTDLRTVQDWILQRRLKAVPGVIDVTGWGGKLKTYEVIVDQPKLAAYGLSIPQVLQVLNGSNINVGGQTINIGPQAAVVRGIGLIRSIDDIRNTMIAPNGGAPVLVKDIADVRVGYQPRLGRAGQDGDDDIVEGIVLMRRGAQSTPTIQAVEAEIKKINESGILPSGVRVEKVYDRAELIDVTTKLVLHNMATGVILIFLIQWIFLGNLRSAIVVATTIPFALFFAVIIMQFRGESANLLSVGAIDFGLVVDATVIMVENIFRHLHESRASRALGDTVLDRSGTFFGLSGKFSVIFNAATQVNRAIFFSAAIIIAGFVPLFTMTGIEGHIFGPMARTYAYAITGGLLATFTVSPALASLFLDETANERETIVVRLIRRVYRPVLEFALDNRILTIGGGLMLIGVTVWATTRLGSEFLPHLEEGNLWIRATMPPAISLEESSSYVSRIRAVIGSFPEVETVVSQHGRPDDGTDATGFFDAEYFAPLKPFDSWPAGIDKARLIDQMSKRLAAEFPGIDFNFSQAIEDNVEEAASGVKGENSVKLFGSNLKVLETTAAKIKDTMSRVPGIADLAVMNSLGQPTVQVDIDRSRAARYGLSPGDIDATVQAAIGGQSAGRLFEPGSDRNFPIMVRLAPEYRQSIDAIRHIMIAPQNSTGAATVQIPLSDVADVRLVTGASYIYRENQERYIPIKFSVRDRDLGSAILDAQHRIAAQVRLPPDTRMEWAGEFDEFNQAIRRLEVVVPLSLGMIGVLLYVNFGSIRSMLLAASVIPMALIGGILALWVTGTAFSVSAAIGFVALFGISSMDGIIVLSSFNDAIDDGLNRTEALMRTCNTQMRPVIMTCSAACVGLLPAAVSTGIGSQVQKPLAIVVVGGILLAPVLILVILPLLIDLFGVRPRTEMDVTSEADSPGARRPQPAE